LDGNENGPKHFRAFNIDHYNWDESEYP